MNAMDALREACYDMQSRGEQSTRAYQLVSELRLDLLNASTMGPDALDRLMREWRSAAINATVA